MANLLIEVDEALKQEKAAKLWKEYGQIVIGAIILIVAGTAALSGYRLWDKSVKNQQTEKFLTALESGDPQTMEQTARELRPGIKALALWRTAATHLSKSEKKQAIDIYKKILTEAETPTDLKHLAALQIARLTAQDDPVSGLALLEKSANDINNPWAALARLDVAVLQAHHKKDYRTARDHLAMILSEEDISQSLERKARSLDMLYAIKAPNPAKSSTPAATDKNVAPTEKKGNAP